MKHIEVQDAVKSFLPKLLLGGSKISVHKVNASFFHAAANDRIQRHCDDPQAPLCQPTFDCARPASDREYTSRFSRDHGNDLFTEWIIIIFRVHRAPKLSFRVE